MKSTEDQPQEVVPHSFTWKMKYTLVLLFNAIYIVLFYFLMQSYS